MKKLLFAVVLLLPITAFAQEVRYLIPLYVPEPINGAYGSKWVTELSVVNGGTERTVVRGLQWPCFIDPCPPTPALLPSVTFDARLAFNTSRVQGMYVSLPAEHAHDVSFHLRVRDLSRNDVSWGAEIPIVHLEEARRVINLVDVPRDDRYRTTLRIYDVTATAGANAHVRMFRPTGAEPWDGLNDGRKDELVSELDVPFAMPYGGAGTQWHPSYAEITLSDNSALAGTGKLRIEVTPSSPDARIWAFASITNNTTQQVSVVSPN